MNCQVSKVFILFLITCNSLNSARGFVGQAKDTVDVFGGNYDYDDHDQDYNDEDFEEIELHANSEENLINNDVDQGNLSTGIIKKTVRKEHRIYYSTNSVTSNFFSKESLTGCPFFYSLLESGSIQNIAACHFFTAAQEITCCNVLYVPRFQK